MVVFYLNQKGTLKLEFYRSCTVLHNFIFRGQLLLLSQGSLLLSLQMKSE